MPHFHLHIRNGSGVADDEEGREFRDLSEAKRAALQGLRDLMAEELRSGVLYAGSFIEVTDSQGAVLAVVTFTDAVELKDAQPNKGG